MPFNTGDRVRIVERDVTAADVKSGLYYEYFAGLTGVVERAYDDGTVSVKIDLSGLPADIRKRHEEVEESVSRRFVKGLSEEAKDKLSEKEQAVRLSYNVLVSAKDLEASTKPKSAPRSKSRESKPAAEKTPKESDKSQARPSQSDIEKAEADYLKSIAEKQKDA